MEYCSVAQTAEKWNISQRSVRNYCAEGRVPGAFLTGKTWNIPAGAEKSGRVKRKDAGRRPRDAAGYPEGRTVRKAERRNLP